MVLISGIPLHVAINFICMSLQNELGATALQAASKSGHVEIISILLRRGTFIDFVNRVSLTSLQCILGHSLYCHIGGAFYWCITVIWYVSCLG